MNHFCSFIFLVLLFFIQNCFGYPYLGTSYKSKTKQTQNEDPNFHVYSTWGVHHRPIAAVGDDCDAPYGCLYQRGPGEPSDPYWPIAWSSNWTMYRFPEDQTVNVPPYATPPEGFTPDKDYYTSWGYSYYDATYNNFDGAMMEHYEKHCLPIFPLQNLSWTCSFVSLGKIAYFLRYDDRPEGTPECCYFSKRNHPPRRDFVKHLPYNLSESGHLNNSLQSYSLRPGGILFGYAFYKNYTPDAYDPTLSYRHPQSFYFAGQADPIVVQNYDDFRAEPPSANVWKIIDKKCTGHLPWCCLFDGDCTAPPAPPAPSPKLCPTVDPNNPPHCPVLSLPDLKKKLKDLLTSAAQLEHQLMVSYLYAAASLKEKSDEFGKNNARKFYQKDLVRSWKKTLSEVAREEMGHLHYTSALLASIGGLPAFGIPDFPNELRDVGDHGKPLLVSLSPFNLQTIQELVRFESSDLFLSLSPDGQREILHRILEEATLIRNERLNITEPHSRIASHPMVNKIIEYFQNLRTKRKFPLHFVVPTVADFYSEIRKLFECYPQIFNETRLIEYPVRMKTSIFTEKPTVEEIKETKAALDQDNIGDEMQELASYIRPTPETKRRLLSYSIPDCIKAIRVINEIVKEGEGGGILVNKTELEDWLDGKKNYKLSDILDSMSHLYRFLKIWVEYETELSHNPNFIPSRKLVTNPRIPASCDQKKEPAITITTSTLTTTPAATVHYSNTYLKDINFLPCPTFKPETLASSLVDIYNRMYNVLLLWLQQGYIHQGNEAELYAIESLMFWPFMTDLIRPTLEILTNLPIDSTGFASSGAFQIYHKAGIHDGIVVLNKSWEGDDVTLLRLFRDNAQDIRRHQYTQLFQIAHDLESLGPYIPEFYQKIYDAMIQDAKNFAHEYEARILYGITDNFNQMHVNMTPSDPKDNSKYEEQPNCTLFGGEGSKDTTQQQQQQDSYHRISILSSNLNNRLLSLKFKGWYQVRMATDPDPPNEISGVTGNCFSFGDEPFLDRKIFWQPKHNEAPIRYLTQEPYNKFGIQISEIHVYQSPPKEINLTTIDTSVLIEDKLLTSQLQKDLQACTLDLKPIKYEKKSEDGQEEESYYGYPHFKGDNTLFSPPSEPVEHFSLSLSCRGIEYARRTVYGPAFRDMTPGQRQYTGRFCQNIDLIQSTELQKQIGFKYPLSEWRYYRNRQKNLQEELGKYTHGHDIDPTNPTQLKLSGRILDSFQAMPRELIVADDLALIGLKLLKHLNESVFKGECDKLEFFLKEIEKNSTLAFHTAKACPFSDFQCRTYTLPEGSEQLLNISQLTYEAVNLCKNPTISPIPYRKILQQFNESLENLVPGGVFGPLGSLDIRFARLRFVVNYTHSISGKLTDYYHFQSILSNLGYRLQWEERTETTPAKKLGDNVCYGNSNDRWGIKYLSQMFDTDLMWAWNEGELLVPLQPLEGRTL